MSGERQQEREQERQTPGTHTHKARSLQPSPACKFGQLTLQMSSHCPVAKSGCSEKTNWDRSVGTHKTLLRHPLHQDMGLSYWSPFKRLNWCRVNKQTVKEMAEILIPFHLFRLLQFFPLPQFWASVPNPEVLKAAEQQRSLVGINARVNFLSIHDCLFQGGGGRQELCISNHKPTSAPGV